MKKIKFKRNTDIYCEALGSFGFLYFDFSKRGFGFGQLSVSKSDGVYNCMNEFMGKKTCTELVTNFLLSHAIESPINFERKENAWDNLAETMDYYHKETKKNRIKFLEMNEWRNKEDPEKLAFKRLIYKNHYMTVITADKVRKNGSKIQYTLRDEKDGSILDIVIDAKKVPSFEGYCTLHGKLINIHPVDLEFLDVENKFGTTDVKFNLLLSFVLSIEKQQTMGFKAEEFVESVTIYECVSEKLKDCVIEMPKRRLNAIEVDFEYNKENSVFMRIKDGGKSFFVKMNNHVLKDDNGEDVLGYNTWEFNCEAKLVCEAFAKVIIEMELCDKR